MAIKKSEFKKTNRDAHAKKGASIFIRWLGAYGGPKNHIALPEMIRFEVNRTTQFACERITRGQIYSDIPSSIGLLVDNRVIVRNFRGDCWSVMTPSGCLKKTKPLRNPKIHGKFVGHRESFGEPNGQWITGIVVRGVYGQLKGKVRHDIREAAEEYGLPVYELVKNFQLRPVQKF